MLAQICFLDHKDSHVDSSESRAQGVIHSPTRSNVFCHGAPHNKSPPDLILVTADSTHYYVHTKTLLKASTNKFNCMLERNLRTNINPTNARLTHSLPNPIRVMTVSETSEQLNIILHTTHNLHFDYSDYPFSSLKVVIAGLSKYGIPLQETISPSSEIFAALESYAPKYPLELYTLASSYNLECLAVTCSVHLLSFNIMSIEDETLAQIGAEYTKRLFVLHHERVVALKRLLKDPPNGHLPTPLCDAVGKEMLTRGWSDAAAFIASDARPGMSCVGSDRYHVIYNNTDMSNEEISRYMTASEVDESCSLCRAALNQRVDTLLEDWALTKVSD